jgi:hypothetical protein
MTWYSRGVILLLLAPLLPVAAAPPNDAEITRLIKQLDSDDFDTREAASKKLEGASSAPPARFPTPTIRPEPIVRPSLVRPGMHRL